VLGRTHRSQRGIGDTREEIAYAGPLRKENAELPVQFDLDNRSVARGTKDATGDYRGRCIWSAMFFQVTLTYIL